MAPSPCHYLVIYPIHLGLPLRRDNASADLPWLRLATNDGSARFVNGALDH
jgi:hypothetical protein